MSNTTGQDPAADALAGHARAETRGLEAEAHAASLLAWMEFLEFSDKDAAVPSQMHRGLCEYQPRFGERFDTHLNSFPVLRPYLQEPVLARLKFSQSSYFSSLNAGHHNPDYVKPLVLETRFSTQYQQVLNMRQQQDCFPIEAERAALETDYAVSVQALAEHWKFPEVMQLAVARHLNPDEARDDALAALIDISDATAHALDFSGDENALLPGNSTAAWKFLKTKQISFGTVIRTAQGEFESVCEVLAA